ncbi:MAG: hypothetical protein C0462_05980 [Alcanivorax sp.]|nr:hypothetical protein [Alcanivorax sp.]
MFRVGSGVGKRRIQALCQAGLTGMRVSGRKGGIMQVSRSAWSAIMYRFHVTDWLSVRLWAVRVIGVGVFCGAVAILIAEKL